MTESAPVTERLATFALELKLADVPPAEVRLATRLVADALGCGIAARGEELAQRLAAYALRHASRNDPHATLLVGEGGADLPLAALANGAAVRMLDANDIYCPPSGASSGGHFSDAIPALLGAAEVDGGTGAETLAAIIAVYEIQGFLAEAAPWRSNGWHPATLVTWAAPAPVARLLGRPMSEAITAISLAGTTGQAFNSWLRPGRPVTAMKSVAPGLSDQRAVEAVELAREGVSAPDDALETMLRQLGCDPETVPVDRLGTHWTIGRNLIKRCPAQFYTQAAVQATLDLVGQGVRPDQVDEVTIYGHAGVCGMVQGSPRAFKPESHEDADHSTPFVVAMALRNGRLSPADYHGDPWLQPELRELMGRIRLVEEPDRQRALAERGIIGCRVAMRLRDGRELAAEVAQPRGHPENPLSDEELVGKLDEIMDGRLGSDGGRRLLEACDSLPEAPDLSALLALLRA